MKTLVRNIRSENLSTVNKFYFFPSHNLISGQEVALGRFPLIFLTDALSLIIQVVWNLSIKALSFTPEGYNRAKSILTEKYGKKSEIVKAYTREILELPSTPNSNQKKISEFSEKLTYCVQALETLKKVEQVNGEVLMTLDKLPPFRGELVRTDPD